MRLAVPLVGLVALLVSTTSATSEGTYTATSFCAWDQTEFDVVIVTPLQPASVHHDGDVIRLPTPALVPSADPSAPWDGAHAQASLDVVEDWTAALHGLAATPGYAHLSQLTFRTTLVGPDADPTILQNADVVIFFTPVQDAGGRTVESCTSTTEDGIWGSWIVMNQWFLFHFTPADTYNILLHEFGHALGLDHIDTPAGDTMNSVYPHTVGNVQTPRECLSNLDVLQAAAGFRWLDGVTPYVSPPPATTIPASEYARPC